MSELDGDGLPEIIMPTFGSARIFESSGDNTYVLRQTIPGLGIVDGARVGDSDGDGRRELMIAQESFPSRIRIFEATADNVYTPEATSISWEQPIWMATGHRRQFSAITTTASQDSGQGAACTSMKTVP